MQFYALYWLHFFCNGRIYPEHRLKRWTFSSAFFKEVLTFISDFFFSFLLLLLLCHSFRTKIVLVLWSCVDWLRNSKNRQNSEIFCKKPNKRIASFQLFQRRKVSRKIKKSIQYSHSPNLVKYFLQMQPRTYFLNVSEVEKTLSFLFLFSVFCKTMTTKT